MVMQQQQVVREQHTEQFPKNSIFCVSALKFFAAISNTKKAILLLRAE
jgi:hypothetical protein